MFGYATDETPDLLPATLYYSHRILERMADDRHARRVLFLEPDAKSQVTLHYKNEVPVRATALVVSTQHAPGYFHDGREGDPALYKQLRDYVVGVFHDVLLTLGMLSLTHLEFSMTSIAALLTVIGYSMNEKVITFDRLKENLRKYKTTPLREIIDLSENERLSRTIITGTTALLALGGTMFFGGPVLFPLVFTMTFGIIIGTYSSIYIALPLILVWGVKRGEEEATPIKLGAGTRP
jgi:hypothetical protein